MTPEQKEKNKQYILDHFEEYVIDSHGNFVNVAPDTEGDEWFFCFGEKSLTSKGYREIKTKLFKTILQEIKDWELDFYRDEITHSIKPMYFKHRASGRKINKEGFDFDQSYQIIGELGYRKGSWEDYKEWKKITEERKEWFRSRGISCDDDDEQFTPSSPKPQNQQPEIPVPKESQNPSTKNPPSENNPPQTPTPNPEKQTNNPNKSDQNNPPPEKEKNNSNNPLPSPSEIQNQYNSDKAKSEIDNNHNLTNQEEQNQANELLKVIITAELLIKENKFNLEILTKLTTEKKQNSSLYQLLNKAGRMEKVISQLENIQKSQKNNNNNSGKGNKKNNQVPTGIIWGGIGVCFLMLVMVICLAKRRKKRK